MAEHVYNDAQFRAQFPAFASAIEYPEGLLSGYFTQASCYVDANDSCRLSGDCLQLALNLLTAHLAALDAASPADGGGAGIVSATSIDKVSVTLQIPMATGAFAQFLAKTGYGQRLSALLRVKSVGGLYIGSRR